MTKNKEQINIARVIYDAYPHSDLLPIDPEHDCRSLQILLAKVTGENIGDGLLTFMVVEIVEGGEGSLSGAIRVLDQARADVEAVLQALQDVGTEASDPGSSQMNHLPEQGHKGDEKMIYRVYIQIEEIDERKDHHVNIGRRYEAGSFKRRKQAARFVENELMPVRPVKQALQEICHLGFQFLDTLPQTELTTELENRQGFRKMLRDALDRNAPIVDDRCPNCGAGNNDRELIEKEFIGIEAIHMHYVCSKCGVRMIEEFKLADVFMDDQAT